MESSDVKIQIAIPMRPVDFMTMNDTKKMFHIAVETIEELCALSEKLDFYLDSGATCKPTIKLLEDEDVEPHLNLWSRPDLVKTGYVVLEFSCAVPRVGYQWVRVDETGKEIPVTEPKQRAMIPELLKQVCDVLICCNLSRIGSIQCTDSLVFENDEYDEIWKIPSLNSYCLQGAAQLAEEIHWPKLHTIEFSKVWDWASKNEGFLKGYGGGATGRALNAFSRLFELSSIDDAQQLMWSMVGIEALYGSGKNSVLEQIREKAQVLLGKQSTFKKKISEMYDYRSRFMHGDMDFPSLSYHYEGIDIVGEHSKKQFETISMATAILTATLQEMILRGWSGLEFMYTVSEKK